MITNIVPVWLCRRPALLDHEQSYTAPPNGGNQPVIDNWQNKQIKYHCTKQANTNFAGTGYSLLTTGSLSTSVVDPDPGLFWSDPDVWDRIQTFVTDPRLGSWPY
jgi:hypothetical protein